MSKERLEEINQRIMDMKRKSGMPTEVLTWEGWQSILPIFTKDLEYLQEQAERVQELEDLAEHRLKMLKYCSDARRKYYGVIKTLYSFDGNVQEHSSLADMLCGEIVEGQNNGD